jgi:hypothetical protein
MVTNSTTAEAGDQLNKRPEAVTQCVNAHDLCWQGGPCPYCEITGYRDARGRFADHGKSGREE